MKIFRRSLLTAVLLGSALSAYGQKADRLNFASNKEWKAGRWFLIGQWTSSSVIQWLDGQRTTVAWDDRSCKASRFIPRIETRTNTNDDLEVLRTGPWVAIEVNPVIIRETFNVLVRKPKGAEYCKSELTLPLSLAGKGGLKPVLVFSPTGSRYFGKNIDISILDLSERSDIQLDLSMAYWYMNLPNRQAVGAAKAIHLIPVALAHVEWLFSDSGRWGMKGFLEQSGASWGTQAQQNLIVSNWGAGVFYQHFLRIGRGLQMRYIVDYSQFRADDGRVVKSVSETNLEAHYFRLGLLTQYYFGDRWSLGFEGRYGLPNKMAGRGAVQSTYGVDMKINYRMATSMTLISGFGYWLYDSSETSPETINSASLGLRLDL